MKLRPQLVSKAAQTLRGTGYGSINYEGLLYRAHSTLHSNSPPQTLFEERKTTFIKQIEQVSSKSLAPKKGSLAGVLVPFCIVEEKPSVLLTKRSHKLTRNKGDVSFPGGKMDAGDKDIVDTALRETNEEIGLPRSNIEIWTSLRSMSTRDPSLNVVPVIGFVHNLEISSLVIDSNEVSSVFTVSIQDLCDPANQAYTKFRSGFMMPLFIKEPHKIWGLTAIVLDIVLENLLPNEYLLKWRRKQKN